MSKKIFSIISIFFLMLVTLVACSEKGKIAIQVETEMRVGETYQIKYELENIDETIDLSWKVSDTGMAKLDSDKLTILALKEGTFILTVTAKTGEVSSKEVTVEKGEKPLKYTITLELNGGQVDFIPNEYDGLKEVILPIPQKEGYNFLGWYENIDFDGKVVEKISVGEIGNKIFYAKWEGIPTIEKYTITLELNGGQVDSIPNEYDGIEEVVLPIPVFTGYTFEGWYETAEFTGNKIEKITIGSVGNKKFYAKWEVIEYKITLELNGGQAEFIPSIYTIESQDILLPIPTLDGYVFLGWYEKAEFTGEVVDKISAGSVGNKDFYAKWEKEMIDETKPEYYKISYELNGGTLSNAPNKYDGKETIYLYTPLRPGYHFLGWYDNADFTGEKIEVIEKGSSGDIILYAKWERDRG